MTRPDRAGIPEPEPPATGPPGAGLPGYRASEGGDPPAGVDDVAAVPPGPELVARLRAAGCVFAEDEARVLIDAAPDRQTLQRWASRRVDGVPLEYLVGWAEFDELRMAVTDGVFVPRLRTRILVDLATELLPSLPESAQQRAPAQQRGSAHVLDICCGAGAVSAALQQRRPDIRVVAADIDPDAVACARRNLGPDALVVCGDLFTQVPVALLGRIDLLIANAPYVPTDAIRTMPAEARDHEHRIALDGGVDGLQVQRRLIAEAPRWLAPEGWLLVETSVGQARSTAALFTQAGLCATVRHDPEIDGTAVIGQHV